MLEIEVDLKLNPEELCDVVALKMIHVNLI